MASQNPEQKNPRSPMLAVITGASSGIGFALARKFAEEGYDLVIAAEDAGISEAAQILSAKGVSVQPVQADLATFDGVDQLYAAVRQSGRSVDALVLNAGVGLGGHFVTDTDLHEELKMISLNCISAVHLCKHVARDMVQAGAGRILFISSVAAVMPAPFEAVYGATKAFLFSFSEAIRNELRDTGVTVTAILPGPTDTNFFDRAKMQDTKVGAGEKDDPNQVAAQAFDALMSGKDHAYAGSLSTRLEGFIASLLPESTSADIHRGMSEPGSADKAH